MENCIFCKIITREIPAEPIFEDQDFFVVPDKFPKAKVHILLMPKKHTGSISTVADNDAKMLGELLVLAKKVAADKNLNDFKLIFNNGKYAEVPHLHLHLIAVPDLEILPA